MSQQVTVTRKLDVTGATLIGFNPMLGSGKVFYVNGESYGPTGNDNNEGTNPQYPLATITQAVANCRQRTNDWIFIQGFYQTDTFPITLNKRNIHLIGISPGGGFQGRALIDGDDAAAFNTGSTGGGVEMAGLRMGSSDAAYPAINIASDTYFMWIHDCSFGKYIAATDGIYGASGCHMNGWTIEDCWFGAYLTDCGIEVTNVVEPTVRNCIFSEIHGTCIKYGAGAVGEIIRNYFYTPIAEAEADGWAITLNSTSCTQGMIMDNFASQAGDDQGNNPYKDLSTGSLTTCTNGWCHNWAGETNTKPAVA
jgi:hypothetical protein